MAVASLFVQAVCAQAGPPFNTTVPSQIMDQFRNKRIQWTTNVLVYANTLFGILAVIEFAWSAAVMLLEKSDLQSLDIGADSKADVDWRVLRAASEWPNLDSRDHRQLYADRPERSRARRAIPQRRFHAGLSPRRSADGWREHIRLLHQSRHFVGARVCGSPDRGFVHAHHDQLHCHAGRELSRRVGRLHLSRLRRQPMDGSVHGTIHRPCRFDRHQDRPAVLPDLRRIRPEPRLAR